MGILATDNNEITQRKPDRPLNEILATILEHIKNNNEARNLFYACPGITKRWKNKITIENLVNTSGNHLFDDIPEPFGITKQEGNIVRDYFQLQSRYKTVLDSREQLTDLFDEENPEFINWLK